MKKFISILFVIALLLALPGCSDNETVALKKEHAALVTQHDETVAALATSQKALKDAKAELMRTQADITEGVAALEAAGKAKGQAEAKLTQLQARLDTADARTSAAVAQFEKTAADAVKVAESWGTTTRYLTIALLLSLAALFSRRLRPSIDLLRGMVVGTVARRYTALKVKIATAALKAQIAAAKSALPPQQ